jgi:hypothetical protein
MLKPAKQIMKVEDIRGAQSRRYIREVNRSPYHPADYSDVNSGKKELFNESKARKIRNESPEKQRDSSLNAYGNNF